MKKVFTHANCPDGFTAQYLLAGHPNYSHAQFVDIGYTDSIPEFGPDDEVIFADFCPKPEALSKAANEADSVLVLDHHLSAVENAEAFFADNPQPDNLKLEFDMERSGARMVMDYFYPEGECKHETLVNYVQDRDLWKFELPYAEVVCEIFVSMPFTFEVWTELSNMLNQNFDSALSLGMGAKAKTDKIVDDQAKLAKLVDIGGHLVWAAPSPYATGSDLAGKLAEKGDFGAYYVDHPDGSVQWGLRSAPDGANVSKVAELYGGGGHYHAAGFVLKPGVTLENY